MNCRSLIFFAVSILFFSCVNNSNQDGKKVPAKDDMVTLNRFLVSKDRERIQNYIERKSLQMKETPTGLWYCITEPGAGANLRENDKLLMDYECSLLDGTECYSSHDLGPKEIVLGHTSIEAGLYQGLLMLKPGSEAIFILPPFLAYGLPGDGKKIPPRSIVVYKVNILRAE